MTFKSGVEVTQGHSNRYHSNVWVRFPIKIGDKARYWSKIVIFSYPLAFGVPVRGVPVGIPLSRLV